MLKFIDYTPCQFPSSIVTANDKKVDRNNSEGRSCASNSDVVSMLKVQIDILIQKMQK